MIKIKTLIDTLVLTYCYNFIFNHRHECTVISSDPSKEMYDRNYSIAESDKNPLRTQFNFNAKNPRLVDIELKRIEAYTGKKLRKQLCKSALRLSKNAYLTNDGKRFFLTLSGKDFGQNKKNFLTEKLKNPYTIATIILIMISIVAGLREIFPPTI